MKTRRTYSFIGSIIIFIVASYAYLSTAFNIGKFATLDTKAKSDVILVLGAKSYHGNTYNPCLVSRVTHAVDLYKAKYAPKILVSGGFDREDHINEAETMKKIAIEPFAVILYKIENKL